MAKITVRLTKRDDPATRFRATLETASANIFVFRFPALKNVLDKSRPLSGEFPNVSYQAIEAAVQSGAFYARHRMTSKTFSVGLLSFETVGNVDNVVPFAVATTIAIYHALSDVRSYSERELSGWMIEGVERRD